MVSPPRRLTVASRAAWAARTARAAWPASSSRARVAISSASPSRRPGSIPISVIPDRRHRILAEGRIQVRLQVSAVDLVRGDVQALLCDAAKEVGWKDAVLATEEVPRGYVGPRLEVPMFESTGGTETMRTMAGMADLMAGVKAKLDRADRHIRELKEEISAFFSRKPFQIERVEGPDGGVLYRVRVRRAMHPPRRSTSSPLLAGPGRGR